MSHFGRNWKTAIGGGIATLALLAYLAHLVFGWGKMDHAAFGELITALGLAATAINGLAGKDFDKGSNADADVADRVVRDAVTISQRQRSNHDRTHSVSINRRRYRRRAHCPTT